MREHSMIDLITNSSTSVYIYPSQEAIEKSKELIQNIFNIIGFEEKVEDYFEFSYEIDPDFVERLIDMGDEEFSIIFNKYLENNKIDDFSNIGYLEKMDHYNQIAKDFKEEILLLKEINEYSSGDFGDCGITNRMHLSLVIKSIKNGEDFPFSLYFNRIFETLEGPG